MLILVYCGKNNTYTMKVKFRRSTFAPDLSSTENRLIFLLMNVLLIIGGIIITGGFLYLFINLQHAESIIFIVLPGIALGVLCMLIYYFLNEKIKKRGFRSLEKRYSFRR